MGDSTGTAQQGAAILIVDDDPVARELSVVNLRGLGFTSLLIAEGGAEALNLVEEHPIAAILLDLFMPGTSGEQVLKQLAESHPWIPVIVVTVDDRVDVAVHCMRLGAFDFMTKPLDRNRLGSSINHAIRVRDLEDRLALLGGDRSESGGPARPELFRSLVTVSDQMHGLFRYVEAVASSPHAVLIAGESGTGKELVARAVHDASGRSGPFVPINVAGLDDAMFTDTLFGHRRGAFTGAERHRDGLVERAAGGTLFLDEIGDLETSSQIKLLRLLQEGEYYSLGSDEASHAEVRIVAATNADLAEAQREGRFRRDLYYRLNSHLVRIPPLRDRPEDIPVLARHFIRASCTALGRPELELARESQELLVGYEYPGNVRELQAMIADAVSRSSGQRLSHDALVDYFRRNAPDALPATRDGEVAESASRFSWAGQFPTLQEVEDALVDEALRRVDYNQTAASRLLGISQSTLSRRLASRRG